MDETNADAVYTAKSVGYAQSTTGVVAESSFRRRFSWRIDQELRTPNHFRTLRKFCVFKCSKLCGFVE